MARWFDDYLLADERRTQVSHKANIARERKKKIESGEMKFVPTYEAKPGQKAKTAEERNATRLNNARKKAAQNTPKTQMKDIARLGHEIYANRGGSMMNAIKVQNRTSMSERNRDRQAIEDAFKKRVKNK